MSTTSPPPLPRYWKLEDRKRVDAATAMSTLGQVALGVLHRMPQPVVQLCGPMTTGGLGSLAANLVRFRHGIAILKLKGHSVFDQVPFQEAMIRIGKPVGQTEYCWTILYEFYEPIFRSGLIKRAFFLSGWPSSTGASWERELVTKCGIPTPDFPDYWFPNHPNPVH